jgi:hypothetical protein
MYTFCMGAAGGLATMEEANLQRSSIKIRAHGGIRAACFGRGDACACGQCSGLLNRTAAAVCARAGGAVAAVSVVTAKIAENRRKSPYWGADFGGGGAKGDDGPGTCTGRHHYPWEGCQSPAAAHKRS